MGKKARIKKARKEAKKQAEQRLREIYDGLPTIACKGLCWRSCGIIPLFDIELRVLNRGNRIPEGDILTIGKNKNMLAGDDKHCPLLVDKRCTAHDDRPSICRLYGMVDDPKMQCPHGCQPSRYLSNEETHAILREIENLS